MGVEALHNDALSGVDGYHKRVSNPNNQSIYSEDEEIKLPTPGLNLQLTIDMTLQSILEEELDFSPQRGGDPHWLRSRHGSQNR